MVEQLSLRLAIETSTMTQSIALERDGRIVDETRIALRGGHARVLSASVDAVFRRQRVTAHDLDAIAIGTGPGSFTGLRIGLALARGLAFAANCPLVPVPSPWGVSAACPPDLPVAWAVDARKGEVYAAVFPAGEPTTAVVPIGAYSPERFVDAVQEALGEGRLRVVGDGFTKFDALAVLASRDDAPVPGLSTPTASGLLYAATRAGVPTVHASTVEPAYYRKSEAEIAREAREAREA